MAEGLLWLFAVNLGLACGAGLYESRVMVPLWFTPTEGGDAHWDAAAARQADVGRRFWVHLTTLPLTVLTPGQPGGGVAGAAERASLVAGRRRGGPAGPGHDHRLFPAGNGAAHGR